MLEFIDNLSLGYISFLLIASLILYKYLTRNHDYWSSRGIPGPKPLPFLGNLLELFRKPLSEIEEQRFKQFGRIHGSYDFNQPILTVGDPDLIKNILVKDFNSFVNRRQVKSHRQFFRKWLIAARDDDWKRLRTITSPTFSSGKLKKMFTMIDNCVEDLINKLDQISTDVNEVDLKWLFGSYTMNVIGKCAFATDINALEDQNNPFVVWAARIINAPLWRQIFTVLSPLFILELFDFTIAVPESFDFFIGVAKHVLNQRKSNQSSNKSNDFLQLMIEAEKSDDSSLLEEISETNDELIANRIALKVNSNASKTLAEEEVVSNIVLFLLAGYETTASLLTFSVYNLAVNPETQQKLYEELSACSHITYESVSKLSYLDAVICETLRINNPVTRVEREANEDYQLANTGITIKKGSVVGIPIHAIHHDPEYFPNPHQFRPERFYGIARENIKPYTFLPFGGGPRNCIGMRFALLEAKLALATTILKFRFTKSDRTEVPLKYSMSRPGLLQVSNVYVNVEKRYE